MARLAEEILGQHREQTRKSGVLQRSACLSEEPVSALSQDSEHSLLAECSVVEDPPLPGAGLCPLWAGTVPPYSYALEKPCLGPQFVHL